MPNHVVNELIIRGLTRDRADEIMAATVNCDGRVDFSILVPEPLNIWTTASLSR